MSDLKTRDSLRAELLTEMRQRGLTPADINRLGVAPAKPFDVDQIRVLREVLAAIRAEKSSA